MNDHASLLARRNEIADAEWVNYDFGQSKVEDSDGWESTAPGREMSRTIYFADADNPHAPTVKGHLTVVFTANDSADVAEVYAMVNGNMVGKRVAPDLSERAAPRI